jgi:hypothetical protein
MKSFQAVSCVNVEFISNISECVLVNMRINALVVLLSVFVYMTANIVVSF